MNYYFNEKFVNFTNSTFLLFSRVDIALAGKKSTFIMNISPGIHICIKHGAETEFMIQSVKDCQ